MLDSADSDPVHGALRAQGGRPHRHEGELATMHHYIKDLSNRQESFRAFLSSQVSPLVEQMQLLVTSQKSGASPPQSSLFPKTHTCSSCSFDF